MAPRYAIGSDSEDSDTSQPISSPSDDALERALRDAVASIYKSGKMEELTIKRVRLAAEKALNIEEGFFKTTGDWKTRSDGIIKDEVNVQDSATQNKEEEKEEEDHISSPPTKPTKRAKSKPSAVPRKRRKASIEPDDANVVGGLDVESEDQATKSPSKGSKPTQKRVSQPKSSKKQVVDDSDVNEEPEVKSPQDKADLGDSESEMSVVIDEEPKPKRQRQKSTGSASGKPKKKIPAKAKDADLDTNQAEIKRLQGWLIKCGIRKMWARELAPYDTPKAKIKHLKELLKDAGMEGRYSLEKAKQIREERELKADLELVQEGAKRWGKENAEEGSDNDQPRRRLNRGRQSLAFLESDGEETD